MLLLILWRFSLPFCGHSQVVMFAHLWAVVFLISCGKLFVVLYPDRNLICAKEKLHSGYHDEEDIWTFKCTLSQINKNR
ncbi:hypothetical protein TNCT_127051 [Trichonephila clavata]|uniref:Secreted protein n=1 Tax=Trichonephila clavata TaxID=2740835 RepID=A0A8X6FRT4_TRICU|nr:hypothetical protein TNCT_127051 [Trichonephila clavata]